MSMGKLDGCLLFSGCGKGNVEGKWLFLALCTGFVFIYRGSLFHLHFTHEAWISQHAYSTIRKSKQTAMDFKIVYDRADGILSLIQLTKVQKNKKIRVCTGFEPVVDLHSQDCFQMIDLYPA